MPVGNSLIQMGGAMHKYDSFDDWMEQVDAQLVEMIGLTSRELPDTYYYDMYDDGASPKEAAEQAREHAFS